MCFYSQNSTIVLIHTAGDVWEIKGSRYKINPLFWISDRIHLNCKQPAYRSFNTVWSNSRCRRYWCFYRLAASSLALAARVSFEVDLWASLRHRLKLVPRLRGTSLSLWRRLLVGKSNVSTAIRAKFHKPGACRVKYDPGSRLKCNATLIIDDIQYSRKSCHDRYELKTVPFTISCCKLHFYHPKL
jgi:hypothetical protein